MVDREKIIKEYEDYVNGYISLTTSHDYEFEMHKAVLALLKDQETEDTGSCRVFQCKKCGYGIEDIFVNDEFKYPIDPRYCPNCGRKVRLDDSD